jgi:hypothetical protein
MLTRIVLGIVVATAIPVSAQWLNYPKAGVPRLPNGQPNLTAPAPRSADGKPDLSGVWEVAMPGATPNNSVAGGLGLAPERLNIGARLKDGLPYRTWARDLFNARQENSQKDNPAARCLPPGLLPMLSTALPRKILQLPGLVVILYERGMEYRQIFTDGRPLPVDPQPAFNGYSSGKWEGDTLVVRTVGFRDDLWADARGNPITEAAKVIERLRRPNYGTLENEITVDDSKAYTAPWTVRLNYRVNVNSDLMEYVCLENEKDHRHMVGN